MQPICQGKCEVNVKINININIHCSLGSRCNAFVPVTLAILLASNKRLVFVE